MALILSWFLTRTTPLRAILVIHNRILREGISIHLAACEDIQLAAIVPTVELFLPLFTRLRPDLVLIDLDVPAANAVEGIRRIQSIQPGTWVIGLITNEPQDGCAEALEAGASAILAKDLIRDKLVPLIRAGRPRSGHLVNLL